MAKDINRKTTLALLDRAAELSYSVDISVDGRWNPDNGYKTRLGWVVAEHYPEGFRGPAAWHTAESWDSHHKLPHVPLGFRVGSGHHDAILAVLQDIAEHSKDAWMLEKFETT